MNEKHTREQFIDKELKKRGWIKGYIKEEVNSVKSKFKIKEYVLSQGSNDDSGRFIDYLLLAEDNSPIALIEAKKFSVSEDEGRAQSRTYLKDIESQTGERIPIFLTNGIKWLLIDQEGVKSGLSFPSVKSIPIFLPPISLQNKFASIVKEVESMKEQQKHSKEQIDNLFNALMQKAFKGELVV